MKDLTTFFGVGIFCLLFSFQGLAGESFEKRVSLDEVELLVLKKKWHEAMRLISQVSYSERGAKWEKVLERAAAGYLQELQAVGEGEVVSISSRLMNEQPLLKRSPLYREARNRIILQGEAKCFEDKGSRGECARRARLFLQQEPDNIDLISGIAEKASLYSKREGLSIYSAVLNITNREALCGSDGFQQLLFQQVQSSVPAERALAEGILEKDCWTVLSKQGRLQRGIASGESSSICRIAKKKRDLSVRCP